MKKYNHMALKYITESLSREETTSILLLNFVKCQDRNNIPHRA